MANGGFAEQPNEKINLFKIAMTRKITSTYSTYSLKNLLLIFKSIFYFKL